MLGAIIKRSMGHHQPAFTAFFWLVGTSNFKWRHLSSCPSKFARFSCYGFCLSLSIPQQWLSNEWSPKKRLPVKGFTGIPMPKHPFLALKGQVRRGSMEIHWMFQQRGRQRKCNTAKNIRLY